MTAPPAGFGSQFTRHHDLTNVRDAYPCAAFPRSTAGGARRHRPARWVVDIETNAVTDNPLYFIDDSGDHP